MPDGKLEVVGQTKVWRNLEGLLHRLRNRPALVGYGMKKYYVNGKLHRTDGPAIISPTEKSWFIDGKLHRVDGPAFVYESKLSDESVSKWFQNGKYFRENGLPTVEYSDGRKEWHTLIDTDSRDYNFYIWTNNQKNWRIQAGCRDFTVREALKHWGKTVQNNPEAISLVKQGIKMIAEAKAKIAAERNNHD